MAWRTGPTTAACFQDVTKNLRDLFGSFNFPPAADDRQLSDYFHFSFRKNRNEMRFFFLACHRRVYMKAKREEGKKYSTCDDGLDLWHAENTQQLCTARFSLLVVANRSSSPAIVDRSPMKTLFSFFLLFFLSLPPKNNCKYIRKNSRALALISIKIFHFPDFLDRGSSFLASFVSVSP